ncbi:MAG: Fur family transcriptional regulator [Sphingomonadales bacterium]
MPATDHHGHAHHYVRRSPADMRAAINHARELARQAGKSLTRQREDVLRLLLAAERPLGAYDLMARLGAEQNKVVAPPTVYRALEFLMELGAIARIESSNEYLCCAHPGEPHDCMFLICTCCGKAMEIDPGPVAQVVDSAAGAVGFAPESRTVEIRGRCAECR